MKVLIVNTYDRGGAANACIRLHSGLLHQGIDSKLLLLHKEKNVEESYAFEKPQIKTNRFKKVFQKVERKLLRKLGFATRKQKESKEKNFLKSRAEGLELFSFPDSPYDITTSPLYKEADIINLHWVAGFLDYESFFRKNTKPVVWTLHDMNPFTGGEHYEETTLGMDVAGNPLSRVFNTTEQEIFTKVIKIKEQALQHVKNITVVAPSSWLATAARVSEIFRKFDTAHIPYGLDAMQFTTYDKTHARTVFNLPLNKKIVLFVADSVTNERKGFRFLLHALQMLQDLDILLCAVGRNSKELEQLENVVQLGYIEDERSLSMCYSAADVFVIPSIMDNLPNTVLESLYCGTPVIGFPVGGLVDMVQSGVNGILAQEISSRALANSIITFFKKANNYNTRQIRNDAIAMYSLEKQALAYNQIYKSVVRSV